MKNKKLLTVLVALTLIVATVCTSIVVMGSGSNVEVNMSSNGDNYLLSTLPAGLTDGDTLVVICDADYGTSTPGAFVVTEGAPNLNAIKFVVGDVAVTAGLDLVNTALDSSNVSVTGLGMFVEVESNPDLSATAEKLVSAYKNYIVAVGAACADVNETEVNSGKTVKFDVKAAMPAGVNAVVYDEDMNVVDSTYTAGTVSFEGKLGTGYVVIPEFVAVVDGVGYVSLEDAIAAGEGGLETPVAIIGGGNYTISTDSIVVVGVVNEDATIKVADDCLSYTTTVTYEGETYTAYAICAKDYVGTAIVDIINANAADLGISAKYVNGALKLFAVASDVVEAIDFISYEKIKDIVSTVLPVLIIADEVVIDNETVFDGDINFSGIKRFVAKNYLTFTEFANLDTKTLSDFTLKITNGDTTLTLPVTISLNVPDKMFADMQKASAVLAKYIEVKYTDSTVNVFVDATNLYDYALTTDYLSGYTTKEVRDRMNSITIYDVLARAEVVVLPSKLSRLQNEYDTVIDAAKALIAKIESTSYAPVLNSNLGLLDMDNDGVYEIGSDLVAGYAYTLSIAVHDQYTATFVTEDGTVVYTTTILEGEVPEFKGKIPYKAADVDYTYTFAGWSDGTNVYFDSFPALLADTTYVATYDKESNACKHTNKEIIPEVPANCCNPGTTEGWICLDCNTIFGCEEIPATGNHITIVVGSFPAKCEVPGYTGDTYCQVSGMLIARGDVIPALDHIWGDWVVVTPAEIGVAGLEESTCILCGAKKTRDIAPLVPETPEVTPTPTPDTPVVPEVTPTPTPDTPVVPEVTPTPTPDTPVVPEVTPTPTPDTPVVPEVTPTPTPDTPVVPEVTPTPTPDVPEVTPTPTPDDPDHPVTGEKTVVFFAISSVVVLAIAVAVIVLKKKTTVL